MSSDNSNSFETSADDVSISDLSHIRTSRRGQSQGNENNVKIKSKIGGPVEVVVKQKVAWPHENVLGGKQAMPDI